MERNWTSSTMAKKFAWHGWVGITLIIVFWVINWSLEGLRTYWAFFPLWLGYCLTIDALVLYRTGTSLLARSWRSYISLFLISAPVWWIFETVNQHLQNWHYQGAEQLSPVIFGAWATISFTTVMPAVFGTTELVLSFGLFRKIRPGLVIRPTKGVTAGFFTAGLMMFALMMVWPKIFFPFVWISVYFILEPINVWLGNRSLTAWTAKGDWRPVLSLWVGVLVTAFFWEMWNYFSYPKWVYTVAWGSWLKIFEMPLLGYGGYLPFALELFAMYHLIAGLFGLKGTRYVVVAHEPET